MDRRLKGCGGQHTKKLGTQKDDATISAARSFAEDGWMEGWSISSSNQSWAKEIEDAKGIGDRGFSIV